MLKIGDSVQYVDYLAGSKTRLGFGSIVQINENNTVTVEFPALGYNLHFASETTREDVDGDCVYPLAPDEALRLTQG